MDQQNQSQNLPTQTPPSKLHQHKPLYFVLAIIAMLAIGGLTYAAIEHFKADEEIIALSQPIPNKMEGWQSWTDKELFKQWNDGTAYVKGEVVEHDASNRIADLPVKLVVKAVGERIVLVYHEGDVECQNTQAASWVKWGQNVNKGKNIKAYGAYKKLKDNTYELTFCDSHDYFILGEDNPLPVGRLTEKFFDEAVKQKPDGEDQQEFQDWQTYRNEEYGFEFKYPAHLTVDAKLDSKQGQVRIYHQIPYRNTGSCDMMGDDTIYDYLTDFEISFQISPGLIRPNVVDGTFSAGSLNGYFEIYGAEGCGDTNYYFPLEDNKALVVKRANIQILSGIINNAEQVEQILKIPGAISKDQNNELFKEILSTFKFTEKTAK